MYLNIFRNSCGSSALPINFLAVISSHLQIFPHEHLYSCNGSVRLVVLGFVLTKLSSRWFILVRLVCLSDSISISFVTIFIRVCFSHLQICRHFAAMVWSIWGGVLPSTPLLSTAFFDLTSFPHFPIHYAFFNTVFFHPFWCPIPPLQSLTPTSTTRASPFLHSKASHHGPPAL